MQMSPSWTTQRLHRVLTERLAGPVFPFQAFSLISWRVPFNENNILYAFSPLSYDVTRYFFNELTLFPSQLRYHYFAYAIGREAIYNL